MALVAKVQSEANMEFRPETLLLNIKSNGKRSKLTSEKYSTLEIVSPFVNINNQIHRLFPKKNEPSSFQSCYDNLGCIEVTEQWYDEDYRPINVEPLARFIIRTEFILFTLPNGDNQEGNHLDYEFISIRGDGIKKSRFERNNEVVFLIHDFTSNGFTGWIKHISEAILNNSQKNIIAVDWQSGAEPPYEQAVANARIVALEIIAVLKYIQSNFYIGGDKIHIIGHGLGAHIAGYVGETMKDIGKITGLDPSGPYFEGMPSFVKLDHSDAKYVEIIHSDCYSTNSQGTYESSGHRDYFVNGLHRQPGCNDSASNLNVVAVERNSLKQGQILAGCSHKRSFKYYIESIENKECQFRGFYCEDFDSFAEGSCSTEAAIFNLDSNEDSSKPGDKGLYLITSDKSPFCVIPYKFELMLCNYTQASERQVGYIDVIFKAKTDTITNGTSLVNGKPQTFLKGETKNLIIYSIPPEISEFKEIQLRWMKKGAAVCLPRLCQSSLFICAIQISILPTSRGITIKMYPGNGDTELKHNTYQSFKYLESKGESQRSYPNYDYVKKSEDYGSKSIENEYFSDVVKRESKNECQDDNED